MFQLYFHQFKYIFINSDTDSDANSDTNSDSTDSYSDNYEDNHINHDSNICNEFAMKHMLLSLLLLFIIYLNQGWQKAGFYSYCPGRRLLPAFTGYYRLSLAITGFN